MAKHKNPTPQELYKARKEKEDQERKALLPPGLYNHGNTCFMNSVLQGLIATPLLYDLAYPAQSTSDAKEFDTSAILSQRSPQVTNGHGLGGQHEKPWEEGMPLGDVFFNLMMKAWSAQRNHQRTNLSAKEVLTAIGKKYDQYLDFAQQDSHEFLRQLLDSMRMEELDIIKKRQPPPPPQDKKKHRRRTTITQIPTDETLTSVADMIFGGKLTSILVCQTCKHVSQSYEEFNDLSLSIKAEDYVRERKRDRLKNLAKKLANLNGSSPMVAPSTNSTSAAAPHSSSAPSSPGRRVISLPPDDDRRASFDVLTTTGGKISAESDAGSQSGKPLQPTDSITTTSEHEGKAGKKLKKNRDSDPWIKISRRISLSVGLAKTKDRSKSHKPTSPSPTDNTAPEPPSSARTSMDPGGPELRLVRPSVAGERLSLANGDITPHSANHTHGHVVPTLSGRSSPHHHLTKRLSTHRPRPFKPTPAEVQYLRHILADVPPSSPHPFALFRPVNGVSHHSSPTTAHNMWMKMNQLQSIEDCLRLFTAVEVLDGENMVGCRRCWKIQNGVHVAPAPDLDVEDESESEEDVDLPSPPMLGPDSYLPSNALTPVPQEPPVLTSLSSPSLGVYNHSGLGSASTSSLPSSLAGTSSELSTPGYRPQSTPPPLPRSPGFYKLNTPGGLPIPLIATIAPDSPVRSPTSARAEAFSILESGHSSSESQDKTPKSSATIPPGLPRASDRDSLRAPGRLSRRQTADIGSTTDDDSGGEESDASTTSALSSANTSTHSLASNTDSPPMPNSQPNVDALSTPRASNMQVSRSSPAGSQTRKKRPKPVLLRPAYKRYLIATPPPVLVIHLKRFQQISKAPVMSFSHGFKKLDDYITFPEYLDLTPYLAPRKEDFGLGKKGHGDIKVANMSKDRKKCVYRLYAVVVHIGNMLGGHYVAYTALPPKPPAEGATDPSDKSSPSEKPEKVEEALPRQWAYISDVTVRLTTLEEVLKVKAYLCMYERV